jgi:hypothetical protein
LDYLVLKHAFNCRCIVSKDTGEITVEQKRINNALLENHNAIIKLVTKATSGYQSWERFRNGCMLILEKASILKSTRMTEALKWGYPNFLGGSNLGGNLGENNEK